MRDCNRKRGFECPNICIVNPTCDWHLGISRNYRNLDSYTYDRNDSANSMLPLKHVPYSKINTQSRSHPHCSPPAAEKIFAFHYTFQFSSTSYINGQSMIELLH